MDQLNLLDQLNQPILCFRLDLANLLDLLTLLNPVDHLDHLDIDMEINGFHTDAPPAAWTDYHTCLDQNALCLGQLEPRLG